MTLPSRSALLLSLTVLAGCGTKTAEPPRDANAPAGEVIALEGNVTAKRATATTSRALALDADVFADDEVATADAASVQIKLAHNEAVWTLGASRTQRVDASAAWSAPKQSANDLVLIRDDREDRTRAAARSGSQEGISTGEAALEATEHHGEEGQMGKRDKAPRAEPKAVSPAAAMSAPVPPPKPEERKDATARNLGRAFGSNESDSLSQAIASDTGSSETTGFGGLGIKGTGSAGGGAGGDAGLGDIGTIGHGSGTGSGYGLGAGAKRDTAGTATLGNVDVVPGDRADVVKKVIRSNWNQIRYCVESSMKTRPDLAGKLTIKLAVSLDGSVASAAPVSATGIDDQTKSCIAGRTKRWLFPKGNAGITIATYEVVVKPAEEEPQDAGTPATATPAPGATPIEY